MRPPFRRPSRTAGASDDAPAYGRPWTAKVSRRVERRPASIAVSALVLALAQVVTVAARTSSDPSVVVADAAREHVVPVATSEVGGGASGASTAGTTPAVDAAVDPTAGGAGAEATATRAPRSSRASDGDGRYPNDPARERFEAQFPAQARAGQHAGGDPATTRWAVLIGINEHRGPTRDNLGSRQDAEDLHAHLRSLGWREDHIVLLTDGAATKENMIQAIAWLARKTNENSVAVLSYSGHTKQWDGADVDGDGEVPDEGLWPSNNDKIVDSYFVHRLTAVKARELWVNIGACEAAGFADPGLRRQGRLLTFSSREPEKSYEDPSVHNSVWGYYLVDRGLRARQGDRNGDGNTTVEEAFAFAAPKAAERTARASHGAQHAVIIDDHRGGFSLRIPPKRPPAERGAPSGTETEDDCLLGICT